ncbi:hypothetical protein A1O3_09330 [Capronia epimyces CBS 606.96]|uniref:Amidase domain-containing protein n=1 Tax=Capronia epimyces CBS 606.96 TaxID=1182542 RepID=W9Y6X1_9EURO|nr:uncharacterized protein A1O3_09330 [Capronia epimyces CBS 606.96]EXJ78169.1 hypothetical protein A1O3_09330 [Capronia epimyces CBS 606.96]
MRALSPDPEPGWESQAAICRSILDKSIVAEFRVPLNQLPSGPRLNVLHVPSESGLLSARELDITACDGTRLAEAIASGCWSAEEVTVAYLKRATIGHQMVNFATEFLADRALATARELDVYFKKTGKTVGPLHGVPISVKEHIGIKNRICHTGYVAWIKNVASADALVVHLLQKAGAVILLRSNEPQSLMHGDTNNNITGMTLNPCNTSLSAGGSSGGEGACIRLRGSAIGIGTDIGGSIRIPSSFNGVYGFRPTALRMPYQGIHTVAGGQEALRSVAGPLANSMDDLELVMRSVLDQSPWEIETSLVPLPWRSVPVQATREMTVGIMHSNGLVTAHPPIRRAMKYAQAKLEEAGIRTVPWEPYRHEEASRLLGTLFFADGAQSHRKVLAESAEPVHRLTEFVMTGARTLSFEEYWQCNVDREQLRSQYHQLMKQRGVDCILCPATNGVATRQGNNEYWFYTGLWNLLDQPALVFPTGLEVDPALDPADVDYVPLNENDRREHAKYCPEIFAGMPICLQVVGKHFRDEETVAAARVVESVLRA